jgi:hypothetical protein
LAALNALLYADESVNVNHYHSNVLLLNFIY